jgi:hypothetical protein
MNKLDESWDENDVMDIDESDYTQMIDHKRFEVIEDTSEKKCKISNDYICSIDSFFD